MADRIETKIREGISDIEYFSLKDQSDGCGAKFICIIVSKEFEDVKLLDRQRRVNEILSKEIAEIHAFELKTWTPKQWESKKSEYEN
eukprot:CAMPEP_0168336474 /NCGR_PEP_ID=MMETSP0213-20121227/11564_1 /TAXON_ID=151035 /ORGANISM="Euplotes harpa, Strain FSP1.4" /LENGTH=86 /DNA_ID=CAMNT_0008341675 /DNA_START=16 /DNA_END=276 /DNA_ORIENTATION=+